VGDGRRTTGWAPGSGAWTYLDGCIDRWGWHRARPPSIVAAVTVSPCLATWTRRWAEQRRRAARSATIAVCPRSCMRSLCSMLEGRANETLTVQRMLRSAGCVECGRRGPKVELDRLIAHQVLVCAITIRDVRRACNHPPCARASQARRSRPLRYRQRGDGKCASSWRCCRSSLALAGATRPKPHASAARLAFDVRRSIRSPGPGNSPYNDMSPSAMRECESALVAVVAPFMLLLAQNSRAAIIMS
jgi:hypothetical protein